MKTFRNFLIAATFLLALSSILFDRRTVDISRSESDEARDERLEATYAYEAMRWYYGQRAYPASHLPDGWRENALSHVKRNGLDKPASSTAAMTWTSLGPNSVGGRVRSIVVDPSDSNTVYCGSVSGGIWKSTDAGASWNAIGDLAPNLVIGCMAIDPTNTNIIYAGTGEGYFNYDYMRGAGVLKSTDAGATWSLLTNFATPNAAFSYYYINKLVIRPGSPNTVYAAMLGGIWKTTDAGASWAKLNTNTLVSVRCTDLVVDPVTPDNMYASFGLFSTDGVYKTTNGGTSWSKIANGFPPTTDKYSRISLGISLSSPATIYASISDSNEYTHSIRKTTNGGTLWTTVGTPVDPTSGLTHLGNSAGGQGWYNNVIAVHPSNPSIVYAGGINLFKSTDGGTSWTMKTSWNNSPGYQPMHADQHAIVFDPANSNIMYFGNDGGMFKSTNGGETFSAINNGLAITQFYSGAINPGSGTNIFYGGTQDNGSLRSTTQPVWSEVSNGGDGGVVQVDSTTPANVYISYPFLGIHKSTAFGALRTFTKTMIGIPSSGVSTTDRCNFIAPYVIDASNTQVLVAGTFKVYRTTNGGSNWAGISSDLTGDGDGSGQVGSQASVISAIGIARSAPQTMYLGTTGSITVISRIQVTTNTGSTWTNVTASPLPDRTVTAFGIDPTNSSRAFACYSGFASSTPATPGHVYLTTNRGATWTNASGNLPDIPVNAIVFNPQNLSHIIVGTDLGVFESVNSGVTWTQQNSGMANVSVADLDLRGDLILFATTHGRGMYRTTSAITEVQQTSSEVPASLALEQNYPNPFNPSTVIRFDLPAREFVSLRVYDVTGKQVATLVDREMQAGTYTSTFDGGGLASGVYYYRLVVGNKVESKKMVLVK